MPVFKSPLIVSSIALLAALTMPAGKSLARDGRHADQAAQGAPVIGEDSSDDIIYVMPPLKPVKGALASAKKTPAAAKNSAPPAPVEASVAPVAAPVAAAAKQQEGVAELSASKPAKVEAMVAESAAKPADAPTPVAASGIESLPAPQEAAAGGAAGPSMPETKTAEVEPAGKAVAVTEQGAEAVKDPEQPAAVAGAGSKPVEVPLPATAPDAAQSARSQMNPTVSAPEGGDIQAGPAPGLAPAALEPAARDAEPPPAVAVGAAPAPDAAKAAPEVAKAAPEVTTASDAPKAMPESPTETAAAPEQAAKAETPAEPASSDADQRIEALLAQGVVGPAEIRLADRATMWLPKDRVFLPPETARKLATEVGLDLRPEAQGMVTPAGGKLGWLAPIELIEDGHVAAEPGALDAAKLMSAFEASLPQVNAQRAAGNQSPVSLQGWLAEPELDEKHRLSACVNVSTANAAGEPDRFFNCEAWALGRGGAIKVGVADSGELSERLKGEAHAIVGTIVFDHGKTYEDFDPATDIAAPYSAGDLMIHDVSPKAAAPAPAAPAAPAAEVSEEDSDASILDLLSNPLVMAVIGLVVLLIHIRIKHTRGGDKAPAVEAPAKQPPAVRKQADEPAKDAAAPASRSLFGRLLPTLYARFARKDKPAPEKEESIESAAPASKPSPSAAQPSASEPRSLVARLLPTLHARFARKGAAAVAKPGNDSDEPAFALKKIATMMKKPSEPAPAPVNTARVVRQTRSVGATALAIAEEPETTSATVVVPEATVDDLLPPHVETHVAPVAPLVAATAAADDLGLVEPGDEAAASAASHAARARRKTDL